MFDRHVGDGQAPFDRQVADRAAGIFDDIARAARSAQLPADVEHDVLGRNAGANLALDAHFHRLRPLEQQGLRGQHVLDLAGADAEGERAKPAVAGGVAIPADDRRAGQGEARFGADDVDDTLLRIGIADQPHAEFGRVAGQRLKLLRAFRVGDGNRLAGRIAPRGGGQVVVRHGQGQVRAADLAARNAQRFKRLGAGNLVDEVAVDIDQAGAIVAGFDNVGVPDLLVERAGCSGHDRAGLGAANGQFKPDGKNLRILSIKRVPGPLHGGGIRAIRYPR